MDIDVWCCMSDEASNAPRMPEYVLEKWWHRLLRVLLMYFSPVIAFALVGFFNLASAKYHNYFYTFEKDYAQREGFELSCTVYESIKSISCGELRTPEEFMSKWTAIRGGERNKKGQVINDAYRELRSKGYADFDLAKDIIEGDKIRYKMQSYYDYRQLASGFGWTWVQVWFFIFLAYRCIS